MRLKIASLLFVLGGIAWLVAAGFMIASRVGLLEWAVWALSAPAWILVCMLLAGRSKPKPPQTVAQNIIDHHARRYGAMRKDEE